MDSRTGFGGIVTHHHHIFSKTGTVFSHSKSGMVPYQGDVHTVGIGIIIILLCVTNIMTNIHRKNAT